MLVNDPDDGLVDCSSDRYSASVISENKIDSVAFVRFEIPDARQWSIGFIYHDVGGDSSSLTYVGSTGPDGAFARHLARRDGELVHERTNERIPRSALRTGWNELAFRTSSYGSFLRLNDESVIEVPVSQLIRRRGRSELCVGFRTVEDERYSIRYTDLRTRFTREGVSGRLTHSDPNDPSIVCPTRSMDHAYFADFAMDSWIVLNFVVPEALKWSFGFVYHGSTDPTKNSRTFIRSNGSSYLVEHVNYDAGRFENKLVEVVPDSLIPTWRNRLEFETTQNGSSLFLNGEKVLDVPSSLLARRQGSVRLCTNLYVNEPDPYSIRFSDLWAWASDTESR